MASIKAVIVQPDGTVQNTEIENDLSGFQAAVGGYIQGVFGNVATMYVDEEGLLKRLPFNPRATIFAIRILGFDGIQLFGPVLILGTGDGEGNDTDVRPAVVDYFKEN